MGIIFKAIESVTHDAIGWKVNGAGGDGGSVTLLCGNTSDTKRALIRAIETENNLYKNIPISLSRFGLRTWEQQPGETTDP